MSLNIDDFSNFKIVQNDGNWTDKKRFILVVDYWTQYFNTISVKGNLIHAVGEKPNPIYDTSKKLIVIKGHTSINLLAILFAAARCGHTLYFDNATNLTKAWYKKVKPDILMVGDGDLSFDGSRYSSGEGCIRLLFTRRFEQTDSSGNTYQNKTPSSKHTLLHHKDKKDRKFSIKDLSNLTLKDNVPGVAYIEQDSIHQVNQLVDTIIPLMESGCKIVLHTGLNGHDHKQSIIEHSPDIIYWGKEVFKMIEKKEPFINELVPHPVFVPHIRKTKKVVEKS